ncbi:MAG: NAD(P)-dependent oxidoreductase [Burkholderiales bacterium]|nr:NAD(P)-dependent oxidoreductase [Burkholderiales bacterium]
MNVGLIGAGAMGAPMARRLLAAGHALHVWARRPETVAPLVAAGAVAHPTAAAVGAAAAVVFTVVTAGRDVVAVTLGDTGLVHGLARGSVVVDCSTIDPDTARDVADRLAAHGIAFLDAPVSGGSPGAEAGTLSMMVGGDADALARVRPLLDVVAATIVHIGPSGAGQTAKACNQLVLTVAIAGIAEAMALAEASGVDLDAVVDVLSHGLSASRMLDVFGRKMAAGRFDAGVDVRLHHKDAQIVIDCAAAARAPVPAAALASQAYAALDGRSGRRRDSAAVLELLRDLRRADAD